VKLAFRAIWTWYRVAGEPEQASTILTITKPQPTTLPEKKRWDEPKPYDRRLVPERINKGHAVASWQKPNEHRLGHWQLPSRNNY